MRTNAVRTMARALAASALAVLLLAGAAWGAGDLLVRGIVFESGRGVMMETEEGDLLQLIGMNLEEYAETVVFATGSLTVSESGDEVFVVTSIRPDDGATEPLSHEPQ